MSGTTITIIKKRDFNAGVFALNPVGGLGIPYWGGFSM